MTFGTLSITPSLSALFAALLGLLGVVIWWLMRKRQKRVWLPTVRILRLEARLLPRLVLRPPPLLSFVCFLLCALVIVGMSLQPRTQIFTPFEPNQTRIHIFCDMSPSVSAHVTLEAYATRMAALYNHLKGSGRVSISTSHAPTISEPQSGAEVAELIRSRGFHRAGLSLGSATKDLLQETAEVDRLFIVSDRDQHSWTGFNWRYLLEEMQVVFYDLSRGDSGERGTPASAVNVFINEARFLSTPAAATMDWEVELARRGDGEALSGQLEAVYMGHVLGTVAWHLSEDQQHLGVRISWPVSAVKQISVEEAKDIPLVFRLDLPGGDSLTADNEFRTQLKGLKQDVLIVSEAAGERLLEDPAHQLEVVLEIQGFRVKRYDVLTGGGAKTTDYGFMVLQGGSGGGLDRFCPKSLEAARWARDDHARGSPLPKVWLAPQTLDADYGELCRCYARLLLTGKGANAAPSYCEGIDSRSQWVNLLPSLGAKQIGGNVGDHRHALAFHQRDQHSGLEVLAFTVPLNPLPGTGINHAQMPILVKELLTWQGLLDAQGGQSGSWPRVADIVQSSWGHGDSGGEQARLRASNVPLGESLLAEVNERELPPRWTADTNLNAKQLQAKKDREDPLPWLKLAAAICIGCLSLEGVWTLLAKIMRRRKTPARGALVLLGLVAMSSRGFGAIDLNIIGARGDLNFTTLAREVSRRTSIELAAKPLVATQISAAVLSEPWLWVDDLSTVQGAQGELKPELGTWLKRGGFLIVEGTWQVAQLSKLARPLTHDGGQGGTPAGVWQALPPDHEIMRSFYLLDALPSCNSEIWRGFSYDGRLAILAVPYGFLASLKDHGQPPPCAHAPEQERSVRVFVNLIMVALATDYKRDQIHLPEILKRLR